jgi:hypothetical protein
VLRIVSKTVDLNSAWWDEGDDMPKAEEEALWKAFGRTAFQKKREAKNCKPVSSDGERQVVCMRMSRLAHLTSVLLNYQTLMTERIGDLEVELKILDGTLACREDEDRHV